MDLFEVFRKRQSVRAYSPKPVEEDKLQAILEAVRSAPSAGNFQPYEIYLIRKPEQIQSLTNATFSQNFIAQAPVALVFCTSSSRCQYDAKDYYALQDTVIATTFAMLAIKALGLETCWVAAFAPENVAKVLGLPAGHVPVAIMPVAYGAETPERTTRRELNEFVHEL
jgi:FMN reductase [NAD(P)H]